MGKMLVLFLLLAIAPAAFAKPVTDLAVTRYRVTQQDADKTTVVKETGYLFLKEGYVAGTSSARVYTAADLAAGKTISAAVLGIVADRPLMKLSDWIKRGKSASLRRFVRSTEKYLIEGVPWVTVCVRGQCDPPPSGGNACVQ